jgi:hypothetical protein
MIKLLFYCPDPIAFLFLEPSLEPRMDRRPSFGIGHKMCAEHIYKIRVRE